MHQRKKRKTRQEKIQKILEQLKGTRNISSIKSVKKRILIPKVKNKKGETIHTKRGIACVFAEFYENLYEGEEGDEEKKTKPRTEEDESQNLQRMRSKMPSTASKKEKQKTAVEYELNSSKIAVIVQRKKSARSSMISSEKKTSRRKVGARFAYKSFTRKATEKMQAITSQFAACLYYTNCLPQYYTHVSLHHCTKYNILIKVCSGPITVLKIT